MTSSDYSSDGPGQDADAPKTAYTVSAVAEYLKASLESDPLLADLMVIGEVSG